VFPVTDYKPRNSSAAPFTENATMYKFDDPAVREYDEYIASALRTVGGHLSIGRGGFTLYYAGGARLSGYDCERVKACCIAAGPPVIDSRMVAFEEVVRLAVRGPMVAVGEEPSPQPYHALSYAPLVEVASAYRLAGAEVFNIVDCAPVPATQGE
jgi:hypothetical protein